jgi:predicted nucleic acid-binding protein
VTRFVLDASVALSWIFADEFTDYSSAVADALDDGLALVSVVFPLEVANGILNAVRRNRLRREDASSLVNSMTRLRIEIDSDVSLESLAQVTLSLGLAQQLSAYDASYLDLALRRGLPLATLDSRLASAADAVGVELFQP